VMRTSAFAISLRNSGESSRNADLLQLVTSSSFLNDLSVKKCWNKTSLANTRTFGSVTLVSGQYRVNEVRQCSIRFFDFRMPVFLPFKTNVTVVIQVSDRGQRFSKRDAATSGQHRQPVLRTTDRFCVSQMNVGQMRSDNCRRMLNRVAGGNRICDIPNQLDLRMNSKVHNLDCRFRAGKIPMCLECHVNINRHLFRNLVQTVSDPIPRLLALRARLNLVGKNANQRSTKFCRKLSMNQRHVDLSHSFTGVY